MSTEPPTFNPYTEHDNEMKAIAIDAFKEHVIKDRHIGGHGYLLAKRRDDGSFTGVMRAEVLCGFGSHLHVGGDIDSVTFSFGPNDPRGLISWIGSHTSVAYYVTQKASIGMGGAGNGIVEEWDQTLAKHTVQERLADWTADEDEPGQYRELTEAVTDVLSSMPDTLHQLADELMCAIPREHTGFMDDFYEVGDVTAPRVYYAWAAVRKLNLLLIEEDERPLQPLGVGLPE
ncbi:MAG: hypothetical protein DRH30_10455 [Deltaproteobacteria bacterium]|nr:MAG: hypothetical protein DRH30_10455 [Deltaproteobacteria bacterium]